ncbi:hypothetical protein [Sphingomonas soli]|uniref:hypothetical protein n=1 Tax=Sphingomonas soli TaxID=266127 RepID=UPI0009FD7949|nr:hypothetical protein [Sphingomonas soli]
MNARIERQAERRADALAGRVAAAVREAAPGLRVSVEGGDVRIEGRRLSADERLRWIGGLLR